MYLYFTRFSLTNGKVEIYIGQESSTSSSGGSSEYRLYTVIEETTSVPAPLLVPSSVITIIYTTTKGAGGYGFLLTYYGVQIKEASMVTQNSVTPQLWGFPGDKTVVLRSSSLISLLFTVPSSGYSSLGVPTYKPTHLPTSAPAAPLLPADPTGLLGVTGSQLNRTWVLSPLSSSGGSLYIIFSHLYIPDCSRSKLEVFDGATSNTVEGRVNINNNNNHMISYLLCYCFLIKKKILLFFCHYLFVGLLILFHLLFLSFLLS